VSLSQSHALTRKKPSPSSRAEQGSSLSSPIRRPKDKTETPEVLVCARYDVLRAVAEASGVEQITLWALPKKRYQVSFRIKNQPQEWYLATLRNKSTPRAFVNLGAAAHIAYGLAHAPIMIVNMSKVRPK